MSQIAESPIPVNPSDIACIDLVNSAFTDYLDGGPAVDRIESAQWRRWFLDRYSLTPVTIGSPPIDALVALRRDLRRILEKWSRGERLTPRDVRALDSRMSAAPLRPRVVTAPGGIEVQEEPMQRDWNWVIAGVTASAVELMLSGDRARLKTCTNPNCSWMFYDNTINRSKQFCSSTPCALLIRMRRHRGRA